MSLNICFEYRSLHKYLIVGKIGSVRTNSWRASGWSGYMGSTIWYLYYIFQGVIFVSQLWIPGGTTQRIPSVWVILLPGYLNCCHFFLKTKNCRSPSEDQLVFISRKVNLSVALFNLCPYFQMGGGSCHFSILSWWIVGGGCPQLHPLFFWNHSTNI